MTQSAPPPSSPAEPKLSAPRVYEERTVAFIDILGFSNHVRRTEEDQSFVERLYSALRIVEGQGRVWAAQVIGETGTSQEDAAAAMDFRMQVFSDSLVLSQRGRVAVPLIIRVSQLTMALLELDVLVRGGIAQGLMYHDDVVAFGPAVIEAYKLESKCAKFPRVIVSEDVLNTARGNIVFFNARGDRSDVYFSAELLRRDADRTCHVDFLTTAWFSPEVVIGSNVDDFRRRFDRALAWAVKQFAEEKDVDVRSKFGWVVQYFQEFARYRTSLATPEFRIGAPSMEDNEMEPDVSWNRGRAAYFRNTAIPGDSNWKPGDPT
jgi:hypothetical protein